MTQFTRLTTIFSPQNYDLSLTLQRKARRFHGTVTISGQLHSSEYLSLHAKDLTIEKVLFDGKTADVSTHDNDEIRVTHTDLTPGDHIVTLQFSGTITDAMHGLYPCYFEVDGEKKELLATQFESHHAREVFPCVDEPAAKATFDLTLTTEDNVTVLGNMPVQWQRKEAEGLVTKFDTTPRMSSYLLAWVVGDLHKKSATTKDGVEVNVWATRAHAPSSLTFALETATKTIEFYNEYFDTPYPLPKCDQVALPDFSSGAMENWGLVTYRETALLASENTSIPAKRYIATVITHELSHQWFGNLVTMQWWDDLWLNESFATLMEYIAVDALYPEWNIWRDFATNEALIAMRRDSLEGVQPVQVAVNHPDEISTLFDGAIVYAKGARLMRMLQTYLGSDVFSRGLKQYFKVHAYGNTIGEDLWSELSRVSGKDVSSLMNAWISQPGFPVVNVGRRGDAAILEQEQFFIGPHTPSQVIWPIPLGGTDHAIPELLTEQQCIVQTSATFRLNKTNAAHFITRYQPDQFAHIISEITNGKADEITRLQILSEQILLAKAGITKAAELLPLLKAYQSEASEPVWNTISLAITTLKQLIEGDDEAEQRLRTFTAELAQKQYQRLGWSRREGELEDDTTLRATIISLMLYSELPEAVEKAHRLYMSGDLTTLDPELRTSIIANEVRFYDEEGEVVKQLLSRYRKETDGDIQQDIALGITSTRRPESVQVLLEAQKDASTIRPQDVFRWFAYLVRSRYARTQTWQWMQTEWQWIEAQFSGDKSLDYFPRYAANALRTREELDGYHTFFTPLKENPSLRRAITIGEGEIAGRIEQVERDGPLVKDALTLL